MIKWTLLVLALASPSLSIAAVFKCDVDGQTVFSDSPCGDDAEEVTVSPVTVGGQLDTGTDVETYQPEERKRSRSQDECPYISSTEMRRLTIKHQIKRGMKPADVRRSWGQPSSINTGGTTQWAYHYPSGSASYVYFRNGCVSNWSGYYRN
ncbi:DUF4124 domain-containing protein [Marinobacter oulmenensis]